MGKMGECRKSAIQVLDTEGQRLEDERILYFIVADSMTPRRLIRLVGLYDFGSTTTREIEASATTSPLQDGAIPGLLAHAPESASCLQKIF
jgi:hypothetical protein